MIRKKKQSEEPFFLAVGLYRPHIPYIAPKKYFGFYKLDETAVPSLPNNYKDTVPKAALASTPEWPNFGTTVEEAKKSILAYDACVSFIDSQIGNLLYVIREEKLHKNTVIVILGDHGYHLGEHGLWRKNSLYEESARSPLLIYSPTSSGGECKKIVEFINIFPTIADLCGLPIPKEVEGVSMKELVENPKAKWDMPAFTETHFRDHSGYSVRTQGWRYTEWGKNGIEGPQDKIFFLGVDYSIFFVINGSNNTCNVNRLLILISLRNSSGFLYPDILAIVIHYSIFATISI